VRVGLGHPVATPSAALSVAVVATSDPVNGLGDEIFTCTVTNASATAAANVRCVIQLPNGASYTSSSGTGWTINRTGQVLVCTRASVTGNASAPNIVVHCSPRNLAERIHARASVTADNAATCGVDCGASVTGVLQALISAPASRTGAGDISYTVSALNEHSGSATGVTVVVTLDASLTYTSATGTGWTFGVVGQVVTATLTAGAGALATGAASPSFAVHASAPDSTADVTTTAVAHATNPLTSPTASATTHVTA
jgi:uncharacterized repeat protein (TIGR01451 family)